MNTSLRNRAARRALYAAALFLLALTAGPALGDSVKIKRLKAHILPGRDMWVVEANYEVRAKNIGGPFQLVLFGTERGRSIVDCEGRPIEVIIPLEQPTCIRGKELRFAGRASLTVYRVPNFDRKNLRLNAVVTYCGDDRPLAQKNTKLKIDD